MIFGALDGGGAPPDTERAIPGSDLFRVSAGNGESPCTCLGVIADQVVTAGPGYGESPCRPTLQSDQCARAAGLSPGVW
jgi:hypothetical protein